jgi:type I restriction enzyme M protein
LNGLENWDHIDNILNSRNQTFGSFEEAFDIILTNPPFGSQGKIKEKTFLKRYDLGHKWNSLGDSFVKTDTILSGQVPDILFIERCLDFLKPGGRMAIVLPNGDLENLSLRYLRKYIQNRAELLAVLLLPSDTFIPFGTGVKASILFLQKKPISNTETQSVFFGEIQKLGYTANKTGSIIYKRSTNGEYKLNSEGNPIVDEDIFVTKLIRSNFFRK